MAEIYERSLSMIIAQEKFRDSFDHGSQTRSGEERTWKGDHLEIPCVVNCFFLITRLTCFGCFTLDVLLSSSERKNQIVDTLGTVLHHILGEFYRRMPCLLSTVFVTYFLESREEA